MTDLGSPPTALISETLLDRPTEIAILVLAMAVMVPAGYGVFLAVDRYCRSRGTLGMH